MAEVIPIQDNFDEMTDFERSLVQKAVGVNIALRDATRVEIRESLGIWAEALQRAIMQTHDNRDERSMRSAVSFILKDAQDRALIYRRKAQKRARERSERKIRGQ